MADRRILALGLPEALAASLSARLGLPVDRVEDGRAPKGDVALVIVDCGSARHGGRDAVRAVRALPHVMGAPFVCCVDPTAQVPIGELLELGARTVVFHPLDVARIASAAEAVLGEKPGLTVADETLEDDLSTVWRESLDLQLSRVAALERATGDLLSEGGIGPGARAEAERAAHLLAGSLGVFGFKEGSGTALRLERAFAGAGPSPADGLRVSEDVVSLRRIIERSTPVSDVGGRVVPEESPASGPRDLDVVVVEDDDALGPLLVSALQTRGYRTQRLTDGRAALDRLGGRAPELSPRLILLDIDLPGLNGLAVLRALRNDGTLRRSRVVVLTAHTAEQEIVEALELGAEDHVAKPFSLAVLLERIRRVLRSAP